MRFQFFSLALATLSAAALQSVEDLYTFPPGTWVENLFIRPNGMVLATTLKPKAQIWQVDPTKKTNASLVATIPNKGGALGITEVGGSDVYYVAAGNVTFSPAFNAGLGTFSIYKIDVSKYTPGKPVTPTLVADMPQAGFLNGMTTLNETSGLLLVADSYQGAGWTIDSKTGKTAKTIQNQYMRRVQNASLSLGINGVVALGPTLYWTNFNQGIIARAQVNATGHQTSKTTVVATNLTNVDDFLVLSTDFGFVSGNNEFVGWEIGTKNDVYVTGGLVEGSTAVKPAPGKGTYYVSTNGGQAQYQSGKFTSGGKIVQVVLN